MIIARPELFVLIAIAAALNLWAIDQNGWANSYYSAAVHSMSTSWHNFFYGSFDASGVMTVDKPPLALWVQALSARIFGFSSAGILIPQALMGLASVGLVYDLTRRQFGRSAGTIAGLVLAVTPITVAISRHNNPDALLILCSVAALWFAIRALEDGRTRWFALAGACIGLGFEAKMGAALLIVPGIAAAWLCVAPRGRTVAFKQLLVAGGTMLAFGLAWPIFMALTPAAGRPWISGTSDNSIFSLIFGYNGLGRLDGQAGGPGGFGGGGVFGGSAGPLRLLNSALGGQAGWLLGFGVVSGVAITAMSRLRRGDARTGWLIIVGGAFLTTAVAFSSASGIFHPYYVSLLAPFTAALVGAGAVQLAGSDRLARVFAPLAIAAGVATSLIVVHNTPGELTWLSTVLLVVGIPATLVAAIGTRSLRAIALAVALGVLVIAPVTWSIDTLGHATSGTFPAGGPESAAMGGMGGMPGGGFPGGGSAAPPGVGAGGPPSIGAGGMPAPPTGVVPSMGGAGMAAPTGGMGGFGGGQSLTGIFEYIDGNGGGSLAVSSQQSASSSIIETGADVVALGGFSGRESEVSVAWLADAVDAGKVRWVLTDGNSQGVGQDGRVGSSELMSTIANVCTAIPSSQYESANSSGASGASGGLYDCNGHAAELRAAASA